MVLRGAVLALATVRARAQAGEALLDLLKSGGRVAIRRHAATNSAAGGREIMQQEDCATQRNLSVSGRADARRIGGPFRARGMAVDVVRSSAWCRCLDTAALVSVWWSRGSPLWRSPASPRTKARW